MKLFTLSLIIILISISCEKNPVNSEEPEEVEKETTIYVKYSAKVQVQDQNGDILYDACTRKIISNWTEFYYQYRYADVNGDIPFGQLRKFTENDTIPDIIYGSATFFPDDTTIFIPNTYKVLSAEFPMYRGYDYPRFVIVYPNYH
jgi:hypothetical protein